MTKEQFLAKWNKKNEKYPEFLYTEKQVLDIIEAWDIRGIKEIIKKYSPRLEKDTGQYMNQKMVHK